MPLRRENKTMHHIGQVAPILWPRKDERGIIQRRKPMNEDRTTRAARESFDKTMATGAETVRGVQEGFTSALENVRDVNVRLIDMARTNTDVAFDFAKAPSDFVPAWTTHTTKQFDMLTKQASELTTLAQRFASTTTQPVSRSVGQDPKREWGLAWSVSALRGTGRATRRTGLTAQGSTDHRSPAYSRAFARLPRLFVQQRKALAITRGW